MIRPTFIVAWAFVVDAAFATSISRALVSLVKSRKLGARR